MPDRCIECSPVTDLDSMLGGFAKDVDDFFQYATGKSYSLPSANLAHIDEINVLLNDAVQTGQKGALAQSIIKDQYLRNLIDLWQIVDDLASKDDYTKMYNIFKNIGKHYQYHHWLG